MVEHLAITIGIKAMEKFSLVHRVGIKVMEEDLPISWSFEDDLDESFIPEERFIINFFDSISNRKSLCYIT